MINRTFVEMYTNVGTNVQDTSSNTQNIIKDYCNNIYADILRRVNYKNINDSYSFSTVAGTRDYALPYDFYKEVSCYDSTNKIQLARMELQELIDKYIDGINVSGNISRYIILDKFVRSQPTSSSTLSCVSSSAADSTQTIRIKGKTSAGVEVDESITLTGTTPAASANSYTEVISITKSGVTAGYVTITSNSAAVTVAVISSAEIAYRVKVIRLHYTPNSVVTISMPYFTKPLPLSSDYDQPVIDCADIIELGATARTWRYKRQFSKALDYDSLYERSLSEFIWSIENQSNQIRLFNPQTYDRDSV